MVSIGLEANSGAANSVWGAYLRYHLVISVETEKAPEDSADDTDEVVREIQLAVPEVVSGDEDSERPEEESGAPEAEATEEGAADGEENAGQTNDEDGETNDATEPMDTNDETLLNEIQEEDAPKVVTAVEVSEE